ncbi:MAG TPA: RNA-binding S4 domain-containing protein [Gemmataceae bacterium]|nr:RNA-binding S4 domain-containing protein [Gemmataceae bacterium]
MNPSAPFLLIKGESITLAQALKLVGFAGTGGQAKQLIRDGAVTVNGVVEQQPGRKLHAGDRFGIDESVECTIRR